MHLNRLPILLVSVLLFVQAPLQADESNAKTMAANDFWWIIELTRDASKGDPRVQLKALREQLNRLTPEEITGFQHRFDYLNTLAYHNDLWAVAYIAQGGCGDDGFTDFRYWLISRGRVIFERALRNADSLAEISGLDEGYFEEFGYVASKVYEEKTGADMPLGPPLPDAVNKLKGEDWDEDDEATLERRFPRTWKKFATQ